MKAKFKHNYDFTQQFEKGEEVDVVGMTENCFIIERHGHKLEIVKNQVTLVRDVDTAYEDGQKYSKWYFDIRNSKLELLEKFAKFVEKEGYLDTKWRHDNMIDEFCMKENI